MKQQPQRVGTNYRCFRVSAATTDGASILLAAFSAGCAWPDNICQQFVVAQLTSRLQSTCVCEEGSYTLRQMHIIMYPGLNAKLSYLLP